VIWLDKRCPDCWRKSVGFDTGYCRRCKKLTCEPFAINAVCEPIVSAHIRAVALLTMTNAVDWNYRFLLCEDHRKDVICFTHPGVGSHTFPVSLFVRVSRFQVFLMALQEAGRL
jgi:hypothetical protein